MRRSTRSVLLALPVTLLVAAAVVFFIAQRTLNRSTQIAQTQHQLGFTLGVVEAVSGSGQAAAFEPVAASNPLHCGAFFAGEFYLAGGGGLQIYAPDGHMRRELRTGVELPVAPITSMATGQLRGAARPQLLLATAGAGLLLLEADAQGATTLRQLTPERAELRDLTAILLLPSGDLLLGTRQRGVLLYSGSALVPVGFHAEGVDAARLEVTSLAAEDSASYLIGTRSQGLFYVHAGTVQHADRASGLPDDEVDALAVNGGKAYAGTPLGVAEFGLAESLEGAAPLRPTRVLAPGLFSHALEIADGAADAELTIGTLDQGIVPVRLDARPHLRNASIAVPVEASETKYLRIDQLFASADHAQRYAIGDGTLLIRGAAGWAPALPVAETAPVLTDRNIAALAFDPGGLLYVGFFDRGLDIVNPATNEPVRHLEDDHLFCVNRLVLDPERGTMAAATANGLVLFDRQGKPRQVLTRRDGLISDHVNDVVFTARGTTLATAGGLTFLTPAGAESLYAFEGLANNHVYALAAQHGSERLFAGTLGGLSLVDAGSVRRNYTATNSSLQHNWITAVASLPDGSELIGTYGAGMERLQIAKDGSASFEPTELPAGVPRDLVINPNALLVTAAHIYAGTLGHGLLVYTPSRPGANFVGGRWALIARGLPSLNVTAFAERHGELFIGTENGLVRISEPALGSLLP